ncbi:MAG: transcriptional regulator [Desulfobacteraceae bacterium]|nr:MAG: transcriptional regulator [Desulfobacteraceae bacterium]
MPPQTLRRSMIALLAGQAMDARDLSDALGLTEKEVYEHLAHVKRSLAASGATLHVTPSRCLLCGYVFAHRRRLTRPGRCPQCRRSKLQGPTFHVAGPVDDLLT